MLSQKKKEDIINMNFEYIRPYIKRVMAELPNLENSVHIEGVAECLYECEMKYRKKVSIDTAIKAYEKKYAEDSMTVKMLSGGDMPPLNTEEWKSKYVIDEDLTQATLENVKTKINFAKKMEQHDGDLMSAIMDDIDEDRFYGTVVNKQTLNKLEKANRYLDIIKTNDGVTIQKFKEANPRTDEGIVAINVVNGVTSFQGAVYKAFRGLVNIADEFTILPSTSTVTRVVFSFYNLWAESREMTDEEMEAENTFTDEDLEGIDEEIERFNRGEFSHD